MTGRPVILSGSAGGINLQRTKGTASKDNLRELLNGYVDHDNIPVSRPGSRGQSMAPMAAPASLAAPGPRGLTAYRGKLYVFHHEPLEWTHVQGPEVVSMALVNPNDSTATIVKIWFAADYMSQLYVAAEYSNGDIFHFWTGEAEAWQPNKIYELGALVSAVDADGHGYVFQAGRIGEAYPPWQPNIGVTVGYRVEPTAPTGWYYEVTNTVGDAPRTGADEPNWPQIPDAVVYEDVDGVSPGDTTTSGSQDSTLLPSQITERYNNPGGV